MKHLLLLLTIVLLQGCGGGSGGGSSSSGLPSEEVMEQGKTYIAYKGDRIIKTSDQANVRISHIDGTDSATVTLMDGSATLVHN